MIYPGVLDWSTGIYNPQRRHFQGHDDPLCVRPRRLPVPGRRPQSDRSGPAAGRLARSLLSRLLLLELRSRSPKTLGIASFYLRAVCQNRNLWGVEDFEEITIRHSKYAASRFAHEAEPALIQFRRIPRPCRSSTASRRRGERIVARNDEERTEFLRKRGFSKTETTKIIEAVLAEEGRTPESIFDFVQGITRVARDKPHQDARLDMEGRRRALARSRGLISRERLRSWRCRTILCRRRVGRGGGYPGSARRMW